MCHKTAKRSTWLQCVCNVWRAFPIASSANSATKNGTALHINLVPCTVTTSSPPRLAVNRELLVIRVANLLWIWRRVWSSFGSTPSQWNALIAVIQAITVLSRSRIMRSLTLYGSLIMDLAEFAVLWITGILITLGGHACQWLKYPSRIHKV